MNTVTIAPKYLTFREAGKYLGGLSANAVRHMARTGKLPVRKLGGRFFIAVKDIDDVMDKCKIQVITV
jgi:hypothetical protein